MTQRSPGPEATAAEKNETSDHELASVVEARLRRSGYSALTGIECQYCDGTLVLVGVVPTHHLKQLAQSLALHTTDVRRIDNRISVTPAGIDSRRPKTRKGEYS